MSRRKMRIAVVELSPRHDEVFPAWLHLAEANGHSIEFFVSPELKSRDIFSVLEFPRSKVFLTSSSELGNATILKIFRRTCTALLRIRALFLLRTKYDLVIANSVEPQKNYRLFFRFVNKSMLVVLHNGNVLIANKKHGGIIGKRNISIVVLSKHVQDFLTQYKIASHPINSFLGLRSASLGIRKRHEGTFCIQGNIDFNRRNYDSLLKAASKLKKENTQCNFQVVGKVNRSAIFMQKRIAEMGISDYFTFADDTERYRDYYRAIYRCRFLLILVDDSRMIYHPFFEDKCTSSLSIALGLGVIPIINGRLAEVYNISECSVLYDSDDVYSGIKTALSCDSKRIESLENSVKLTRQQFVNDSEQEFRKAINSKFGCNSK